jgi:ABC-type molybdate transport system permease subunit
MSDVYIASSAAEIKLPRLERKLLERRALISALLTDLTWVAAIIASVPLSRFLAKTLTGFPSILAGVFVYAILVIGFGYSAVAGSVALAVLMLPTVVLAAEEAMKQVPQRMKDAAFGMGCTRSQVIWKVVLPTGLPGIITGVLLAVADAALFEPHERPDQCVSPGRASHVPRPRHLW